MPPSGPPNNFMEPKAQAWAVHFARRTHSCAGCCSPTYSVSIALTPLSSPPPPHPRAPHLTLMPTGSFRLFGNCVCVDSGALFPVFFVWAVNLRGDACTRRRPQRGCELRERSRRSCVSLGPAPMGRACGGVTSPPLRSARPPSRCPPAARPLPHAPLARILPTYPWAQPC